MYRLFSVTFLLQFGIFDHYNAGEQSVHFNPITNAIIVYKARFLNKGYNEDNPKKADGEVVYM